MGERRACLTGSCSLALYEATSGPFYIFDNYITIQTAISQKASYHQNYLNLFISTLPKEFINKERNRGSKHFYKNQEAWLAPQQLINIQILIGKFIRIEIQNIYLDLYDRILKRYLLNHESIIFRYIYGHFLQFGSLFYNSCSEQQTPLIYTSSSFVQLYKIDFSLKRLLFNPRFYEIPRKILTSNDLFLFLKQKQSKAENPIEKYIKEGQKNELDKQVNIIINKLIMADIQCVFESMTDKGSIYISNFKAAQNLNLLQQRGIKAIVSMARSGFVQHSKEDIPYYLYIPAQDHQEYEIYKHFNKTYDFIDQARKQTNVLVHCMVGVSRSVTIVMAYLLKKYKTSLSQVITILQRKRRKINPNKGFIQQLKKYAQEEGLKCDFQGVSVPAIRQRPQSAHKKKPSVEKDLKENQNTLTTNLFPTNNQFAKKVENFVGKTVNNNSHQKQKIKSIAKSEKKNDKSTERLTNMNQLLKREVLCNKKSPEKRQVSIEQKINKVREKLKKQQVLLTKSKSSLQKRISNEKNGEDNEPNQQIRTAYEDKKPRKMEDYLKLYTINNQLSDLVLINRTESENGLNRNHSKTKEDMFSNYDLKEEAIYQKVKIIKPRKGFGKLSH